MTAGSSLRRPRRPRSPGPISFGVVAAALLLSACAREWPDPALLPDSLLRVELGLTDADRVYRVTLTGGDTEAVVPEEVAVPGGAWVEFVTADWRVHEVRFEVDSLAAAARAFLEDGDQVDSPPLVELDARFVVSFAGAPEGRYPFVVGGNGAPGRGVVVVGANR